jgi:hypothetical protein
MLRNSSYNGNPVVDNDGTTAIRFTFCLTIPCYLYFYFSQTFCHHRDETSKCSSKRKNGNGSAYSKKLEDKKQEEYSKPPPKREKRTQCQICKKFHKGE